MAEQLQKYLDMTSSLDPFQSSFRPAFEMEAHLDNLGLQMNKWKISILILVDLPGAFDTVEQTVLLRCLKDEVSLDAAVLQWFQYFLSDCSNGRC